MKQTTQLLLQILKHKPKEAIEYFKQVALGDAVEVKFGFLRHSVSITFFITGKPQQQSLCLGKKLDQLFGTSSNLEPLNNYLPTVKNVQQIHFCPYLKINPEPEIYAFQVGVDHKID